MENSWIFFRKKAWEPCSRRIFDRRSRVVRRRRSYNSSVWCHGLGAHHTTQLTALLRRDWRPGNAVCVAQLPQPLVSNRLQSLPDVRVPLEHLVQVLDGQRKQTAVGVSANARHALRLRQQADFYNTTKRIKRRHGCVACKGSICISRLRTAPIDNICAVMIVWCKMEYYQNCCVS